MTGDTYYAAYCEECDGSYGPKGEGTFRLGMSVEKGPAKVRASTHDKRHHNGEETALVVET